MNRLGLSREEVLVDIPFAKEAGRAGHDAPNRRIEMTATIFPAIAVAEAGCLLSQKRLWQAGQEASSTPRRSSAMM